MTVARTVRFNSHESHHAPPANLESEQALLGAILVNNDAYHAVSSFLKIEHFFEDLHRRIYEVAAVLINESKVADPITLRTFLGDQIIGKDNEGKPATPSVYLARLARSATTIVNAEDYGRVIYNQAIKRQFVALLREQIEAACDAPVDFSASTQISGLENHLAKLAEAAMINDQPLIKSSAEFRADFMPPDYHIYGLTQRRFCYSLTAPTGTGKTNILLLIAACTTLGRSFAGRDVEKGRVLFLAGENPDDVRMRWIVLAENWASIPMILKCISSLELSISRT